MSECEDAKCSICAKDNKNKIADSYCNDCNKYLCTSCLEIHNKFNENHVVQGLGDDTDVITEKCGKHADQLITFYCPQHKELLCNICRHLDHRQCQDTKDIKESSDELNADPELQTVPAQLKSALDNINKAIKALDEHLANIKKNGNSFLEDLEVYAKKLLSRIEELKEKAKEDIKSKQEELLKVAKQHQQACALTEVEINKCLDKMKRSKKGKANMFVLKKKGQTIAPKVDALYKESDRLIKGHQFNFMTEIKILDSLNCLYSLVKEVRGDRPVVKQMDVKIKGGTCCSCLLGDGSLVIADYTNRKLKFVDSSNSSVISSCDTDERPTDVCRIGPQEVAVAFGFTFLHVYNTSSQIRTRTVDMGHNVDRMACHGASLYCGNGDTLYVHDVSSFRKLRDISKSTFDRNHFSGIQRIAVNSSGDLVYVTDGFSDLVCVKSLDGTRMFHRSMEEFGLASARGVTTDHHGHVFVCGLNSYNVVKVTEEGQLVGEILSKEDGIEWRPFSLSYDFRRDYLYVGGNGDQFLRVELK